MNAEYRVEEGKVIKVEVAFTFEEVIKKLKESDKNNGYRGDVLASVIDHIATEIAKRFILEHATDVMKLIKPEQVANMASLRALNTMMGSRGE